MPRSSRTSVRKIWSKTLGKTGLHFFIRNVGHGSKRQDFVGEFVVTHSITYLVFVAHLLKFWVFTLMVSFLVGRGDSRVIFCRLQEKSCHLRNHEE